MEQVSFNLKAVAPFRLDLTVWTLRRRERNRVDHWDGGTYTRVVPNLSAPDSKSSEDENILIQVKQKGKIETPLLHVAVFGRKLAPSIRMDVTHELKRLLGLSVDLEPFYQFAARYPKLDRLAQRFRGMKPPRFNSVFEGLANGIACQQFSLEAGLSILNRLTLKASKKFELNGVDYYPFPTPKDISRIRVQSLTAAGFSEKKSLALKSIANDILEKRLDTQSLSQLGNEEARSRLLELKGIGRWTAEYVLLRGLGRINVFPGDDVGARGNLARWLKIDGIMDYLKVEGTLKKWEPYKGLIYFHLLLDGLQRTGQIEESQKAA